MVYHLKNPGILFGWSNSFAGIYLCLFRNTNSFHRHKKGSSGQHAHDTLCICIYSVRHNL